MTPARSRLPSFGFVAVVSMYTLVVAFFAWGFSTPDLDRVWTLHHKLKIGKIGKLNRGDRETLLRTAARHPRLARSLLSDRDAERGIGLVSAHGDGWLETPEATVLRTGESTEYRSMVFDIQCSEKRIPFTIEVRSDGWEKKIPVSKQGIERLKLPAVTDTEIITIEVKGRGFRADPSVLAIRVDFETGVSSIAAAP
jgi:hypothetical protein